MAKSKQKKHETRKLDEILEARLMRIYLSQAKEIAKLKLEVAMLEGRKSAR